ncbi:MAG: membrane protein insertase YidC [Desulfatitalea sp.]|nr:membrane protein insertase YidC [Desulfatitalea sp.]
MEQMRLLLAIGISFLVFFLWSVFFAPPPVSQPVPETAQQGSQTTEGPAPAATTAAGDGAPSSITPYPSETARRARNIVVDTPLFSMTISEQGGAVVSMVLKEYRETIEPDAAFKELIGDSLEGGTVWLSMEGAGINGLERAIYDAGNTPDRVTVGSQPYDLHLVYESPDQVRVERIYRFYPDSYLVDMWVEVHNRRSAPLTGNMRLTLRHIDEGFKNELGFQGPSGLINNQREQVKIKKIAEQPALDGPLKWVSIETLYFIESLIQKEALPGRMVVQHNDKTIENQYVVPGVEIGAGNRERFAFGLFMGPKSLKVLRSVGNDLDRVIHFGWVDFIAKPCLWFMNFIYRFIPNYGIAIIILTIITRLLFWPLAQKSYKSMNEMRKLQPLMQELREKYKDDRAKMNQETMALYRTYKINPLGGCLPMVVQLPVFFALYRMLYQSIELRHAPFFGWINDLAAPDRLFHFGFSIPFMQAPYGIPVLTLIMGASMFLQMKMSPAPGDPLQAKMMMLMPIVFTFIFINFPSGLVLYWLVSNLVSIAQQYYTLKKLA